MGDVDAFLDEVEQTAARGGDVRALIGTASFRRVTWRAGYDIAEVDGFLREMAEVDVTPHTGEKPTTVEAAWAIRGLVERARFKPVRLSEGYDMADVDTLLDEVVAAAERGEPVARVIDGARLGQVRLREGYSIPEVDRFLRQLKGEVEAADEPGSVIKEQRSVLDRLRHRD